MLADDDRYDCLRCARVLGRGRTKPDMPDVQAAVAPDRAVTAASPEPGHPCIPATIYPINGFWFAECPFLNISKHGRTADEAEAKLREHVRSLGNMAKAMLRREQRFFQLPLPE